MGILMGFLLLLCACSSKRHLEDGEYLLDKISMVQDSTKVNTSMLSGYLLQQPNSRWASLFKLPLGIYLMSNPKSNTSFQRFLRRMGEAPVVYDSLQAERGRIRMEDALFNMGYLHAHIGMEKKYHKHKVRVRYSLHPNRRYYVDSIAVEVHDTTIGKELLQIEDAAFLHKGMPFDANILNQERSRITNHLTDRGYYAFNRDFIRFEADTASTSRNVHLKMIISNFTDPTDNTTHRHRKYNIGKVRFSYDRSSTSPVWLRDAVLNKSCSLHPGSLYRESDLADTYRKFNNLDAISATNIRITPDEQNRTLDADIVLTPARLNSIQFGLDGTNTAGDLGAAASFTYQNRNVFHGSEVFSMKARTAFEAIRELKGYADQNYFEYSIEAGLLFPDLLCPFIPDRVRRRYKADSEFRLMYASQNRPEFHRRVLTTSWKYRWSVPSTRSQHRFDLFDVNYVYMPWISETFYDTYIANPESRNAIIAYNYQNLFIMRLGYQFQYSSVGLTSPMGLYGKDGHSIRINVETAGNLLDGICNMFNTKVNQDGQHTLFNISYAQYAKFDLDICKSLRLSSNSSLAMHFAIGIAYPYGNSNILPYEKRYFSGGANSVRGWSVRSLGPGSFMGNDGNIDFINQTGDVKLDMNAELRMHLFWKFDGALFVDAGNIWSIRDYKEQPGGQFRWDTCWKQIAVSYGLGIRLNLEYFLLRFDAGMKAINPAYKDAKRHYPLIHPNFNRDCAFHFAVGLPF